MRTNDTAGERPGIVFRNSILYFGPRVWWGAGLAVLVVGATVLAAGNVRNGLLLGAAAVAGTLIGALFSPAPKPIDHSQTASDSIVTLLDLRADLERARDAIYAASTETNKGLQAIHLLSAQETLRNQDERLARSVENWNVVTPDIAGRVIESRKSGKRRLEQLVQEGNWND
ncbi:hypothetical protein OL239_08630 [Arthrobacter sp. ATA002]|uniref:hypothetical protein n=1 Tax=Arthrobacter sp. ATA002 TaxID=2991715 RepID=UPI0022A77769|nr:hypothetical protein [Arthrobacter sp. ATA002]WAP53112.1 hypothetical protein OL239_08630 [Arthrobacter sp. ATA002]